ncbi:MAG: dipeptidase [Chitinophagaceae bacterium]|nr:dipeptidase [Chitinophagaceae bacterium]
MKNAYALLATLCFPFMLVAQKKNFHDKSILADTHNDVLSSLVVDQGLDISNRLSTGHSDLVRLKEGGVDIQFFSIWTDKEPRNKEGCFKDAIQEIDSLVSLAHRNQGRVLLATDYAMVKTAIREHKLAALIGVEGGHMIENSMEKLDQLADRGMRYMTLTWNNSLPWASSAMDETLHPETLTHKGLTDFGRSVVKRMNELGIIIDLSHTGEQTFYDALAVTTKPVLLSHSSVWSICPVFRNVKDDQIKAVAKNGGVICVNFYAGFISKNYDQRSAWLNGKGKEVITDSLMNILHDTAQVRIKTEQLIESELEKARPTLAELVDHIDYIVKLVGDDYAGIGSDYDGVSKLPLQLDDATTYPLITAELLRRGYSEKSVRKILGGNVLRVMKANFN